MGKCICVRCTVDRQPADSTDRQKQWFLRVLFSHAKVLQVGTPAVVRNHFSVPSDIDTFIPRLTSISFIDSCRPVLCKISVGDLIDLISCEKHG